MSLLCCLPKSFDKCPMNVFGKAWKNLKCQGISICNFLNLWEDGFLCMLDVFSNAIVVVQGLSTLTNSPLFRHWGIGTKGWWVCKTRGHWGGTIGITSIMFLLHLNDVVLFVNTLENAKKLMNVLQNFCMHNSFKYVKQRLCLWDLKLGIMHSNEPLELV